MNPYNIIKKPLLTEKSNYQKETANQYCFVVDPSASKIDIKGAVEKLFNVKVLDVRTMQYMGKQKRVGRSVGRRSHWKKAVVRLREGSKIELFEGV